MNGTGRQVAIIGAEPELSEAVRHIGGSIVDPAEADLVVAVGEEGVRRTVQSDSTAPLLVVDIPDAYYAVSIDDETAVLETVLSALQTDRSAATGETAAVTSAGDHPLVIDHPIVTVTVDGDPREQAMLDVTLLTSEPARISEYGVSHRDEPLQTFRADAVTVATPAGSAGYAHAAGGPVIRPGTGLVVVPIAPFTTESDVVVLPDSVTLTVERDEEPVSIVVDGADLGPVPAHAPITVSIVDQTPIVAPQQLRRLLSE